MSDNGMAAVLVILTDEGKEPGPDAMRSSPRHYPGEDSIPVAELLTRRVDPLAEANQVHQDLDQIERDLASLETRSPTGVDT